MLINVVYFGIYPGRCYDFLCHYRTPPPPFLTGFGRIRKLASVRNRGGSSPPVHPVARHWLYHFVLNRNSSSLRAEKKFQSKHTGFKILHQAAFCNFSLSYSLVLICELGFCSPVAITLFWTVFFLPVVSLVLIHPRKISAM